MRKLRFTSIRQRLLLVTVGTTLMTLGIVVTLFAVNDILMFRAQMVRDLKVLSEVVGDNCVSALVFDSPETAEKNLASLRRDYQIRFAVLYDADGRRFAHYLKKDSDLPVEDPAESRDGVFLDFSLFGTSIVEVIRALTFDGKPVGRIYISAGMHELADQLRRYALGIGLILLLTVAVSMIFAYLLQRRVSEPILRLAAKSREISERGDYGLRVTQPATDDEVAVLFRSFNEMLEQIESREKTLDRVGKDLAQANTKLRKLAMEIALVGEREKQCLASQLHDSPMQKLALAQMQIASAAKRRDRESDKLIDVGLELVRDALRELRTLQFDLSPPVLHQEGLGPALKWLASSVSSRFGIELAFESSGSLPNVEQNKKIALFQCARELVHNTIKHAEASKGFISLNVRDGALILVVGDNGQGFVPRASDQACFDVKGGYGLPSIRERMDLLGGEMIVDASPTGTRVTLTLPMRNEQKAEVVDGPNVPAANDQYGS